MRRIIILLTLVCLCLPSIAQENEQTPYEIALQRIQEAEAWGWTSLYLNGLGLTELPPEIGNLSDLQELNLSANQLRSLPPEIGNLNNLQELYLRNNQLSNLTPEIGNLPSLQFLFADSNQLSSLPPEIGNLHNLCELDIRGNRFESIPLELRSLKRLGESCYLPSGLFVDEHLLEQLPEAVQQGGTPAILDYLENEAWWHLQRLIVSAATGFGIVASLILGLRWRNRDKRKKKNA